MKSRTQLIVFLLLLVVFVSPGYRQPGSTLPPLPPAPHRADPRLIISTGYENGTVNLRACPSKACPVLQVLREGQPLTVLAEGDWFNVQAGAWTGYIYGQFVEVQP